MPRLPGWPPDGLGRAGRRSIGALLLVGWFTVTLIGLASLSVGHIAAMPEPDRGARLTQAMAALRRGSTGLFLVHVISTGCSCTERLFAHLVARGRFPGTEETVVLVGEDPGSTKAAAAGPAGFAFTSLSAGELAARYGLEAAPVLIAFDGTGGLRYAGGYYAHPSTVWPLDERIHAQLASGQTPEPLPVFGCAVSPRLQESLDPLGIVYSRRR
jgi:hypothetical protein